MFKRQIIKELEKWMVQSDRKPLVLRGARQVGKTTLVNQFAANFEQYIYLNLELPEDREPFQDFRNIETLIQTLFFIKNILISKKHKTLIFIDEIQEVPEALNMLRYFKESEPQIAIIAAGSMLETIFDKTIHFPVGRIEYKMVRPVSFPEFLDAIGEQEALKQLEKIPIAPFAQNKLFTLFQTYALIGGMPEIVDHYSKNRDLFALKNIYDSLINSYLEDVEKYASNKPQILHIRHVIRSAFSMAGKRIKFEGFGSSEYRSREMGESLRTLEKTLLLQLIYPNTAATFPLLPDIKRSPRLQMLDTGLINYFVGIQKEILGTDDLASIFQGTIIEHLVGQEILAFQYTSLSKLHFWVKEKKGSSAEVDFLFPFDGKLIPIEVKSGKAGKLKSLHIFMDLAPHTIAIRFYSGKLNITEAITPNGKKYQLVNLPYFLVSKLEEYLGWLIIEQNHDII